MKNKTMITISMMALATIITTITAAAMQMAVAQVPEDRLQHNCQHGNTYACHVLTNDPPTKQGGVSCLGDRCVSVR